MLTRKDTHTHSGRLRVVSRIIEDMLCRVGWQPAQQQRGRRNEQRALSLIEPLYRRGDIPHVYELKPYLTKPFSKMDRRGIDLVVPTTVGDIHLQIKSSQAGKEAFLKQTFADPDKIYIPVVVVNDQLSDEKLQERLRRRIWRQFNVLLERRKTGRT